MNFNINFHKKNNDHSILNILKGFQKIQNVKSFQHKIFQENNAPFILIQTNLCQRPLKILIDTGASLSLLSNKVVSKKLYKKNCRLNLYGLMGKEMPIRTKGTVDVLLTFNEQNINTTFHVVDKQFSGPGDGYLGYDFLSLYEAHIDLKDMYLNIKLDDSVNDNLCEISKNATINSEKNIVCINQDENFIDTIAKSYKIEPWKKTNEIWENRFNKKIEKKKAKMIARNAYDNKIKKYHNLKNEQIKKINPCSRKIFENPNDNSNRTNMNSCSRKIFETPNENSNNRKNIKTKINSTKPIECNSNDENFLEILAQSYECETPEKISDFWDDRFERKFERKQRKYLIAQNVQERKMANEPADIIFSKLKLDHCSNSERQSVYKICKEFPYQFYLEGDNLASTDIIKHKIKLIPNSKPVNIRPYRIPESQKKILNEIIRDYE